MGKEICWGYNLDVLLVNMSNCFFLGDVSQHVRRKRPSIKFIYFHGNMKLGTPPVIQPGNGKSLDDYSICSKSTFWNPIWGLYRDGIVKHDFFLTVCTCIYIYMQCDIPQLVVAIRPWAWGCVSGF